MSGGKKGIDGDLLVTIVVPILLGGLLTATFRGMYVGSHPTDRYLVTGEKSGEKIERVVDLHRIYRKQSATAPILRETDGYGETYHHIYYTQAADDDTIYGFDTIQEIRKL